MVVTWLENRTLNFYVFYKQLAINGLILCPLTSVGALTSVFTPGEAGCQRSGAGSAPLLSAQSCVPVPRMNFADSDLLSLSTHSSHWSSRAENDCWHGAAGRPGSGAGGGSCAWPGEPWLPDSPGSWSMGVPRWDWWEESLIKRDFLG